MYIQKRSLFYFTIGILIAYVSNAQTPQSNLDRARSLTREAIAAYRTKDFTRAHTLLQEVRQLRPDHPGIVYNLAALNALSSNVPDAMQLLGEVASMGIVYHPEQDSDFATVWNEKQFNDLIQQFSRNAQPRGITEQAFALQETQLVAEGITYNELDQSFYISSVRKRKIIKIAADGTQRDFSRPADSLWAAMGMAIDQQRQLLWVATSALPQMEGFRDELRGRAAVVQYDLRTGKCIRRWETPSDGKEHILGDIIVNRAGEAYATDAQTPAVYRVRTHGTLERFLASEEFGSLQGITFSSDEKKLYVSDYSRGILAVDPVSGQSQLMDPLPRQTLLALDGLYYYRGSLIATQNDIRPQRVVRISLDASGGAVTSLQILSANNQYADEPSLGVIVGDEFYFNGNCQWKHFDAQGNVRPQAQWEPHQVMKLSLQ